MPRKTGMQGASFPITPYNQGPSLIDAEGDSMTEDNEDALRTYPVGEGGATLAMVKSVLDESLTELRRIRRANELQLGEDVEVDGDD